MKRLPDIVSRRRKIAEGYQKGLSGIPGLRLIEESSFARSNWQSFPIFIDDPAHQKTIMQDLLSKGVNTRRGVMCAHLEPPYAKAWQVEGLNKSKFARNTGILLPMYSSMSSEDVTHVVNAVRYVINAKTTR
jgi:dTDP-4-amino-4,6-dideoxygalactose transaminase